MTGRVFLIGGKYFRWHLSVPLGNYPSQSQLPGCAGSCKSLRRKGTTPDAPFVLTMQFFSCSPKVFLVEIRDRGELLVSFLIIGLTFKTEIKLEGKNMATQIYTHRHSYTHTHRHARTCMHTPKGFVSTLDVPWVCIEHNPSGCLRFRYIRGC